MKRVLFTPGPTEVPSEVLQAMAKPLIHHRTDEYRQYKDSKKRKEKINMFHYFAPANIL